MPDFGSFATATDMDLEGHKTVEGKTLPTEDTDSACAVHYHTETPGYFTQTAWQFL